MSASRMTDFTKSRSTKVLVGLTILAVGLSVSACGRKGRLDSPAQAQAQAAADGNPPLPNSAPAPQTPGDKDERLFLDPLLGADNEDDDFNF